MPFCFTFPTVTSTSLPTNLGSTVVAFGLAFLVLAFGVGVVGVGVGVVGVIVDSS